MSWLTLRSLDRHADVGLLLGRVLLGSMMFFHGLPKVLDPDKWAGLGGAMAKLGITFAPEFWGAAAAFGELFGGLLVAVGLLTRWASLVVVGIMAVAWWMHFSAGDPFNTWSHAAETGAAFAIFAIAGGGKYALDRLLK